MIWIEHAALALSLLANMFLLVHLGIAYGLNKPAFPNLAKHYDARRLAECEHWTDLTQRTSSKVPAVSAR